MLPCVSKQVLGMECPGCGIQRSIVHLIRGEFVEAFLMYPAIFPMLALMFFLLFSRFVKLKHTNTISIVLMISTVSAILINFFIKIIT